MNFQKSMSGIGLPDSREMTQLLRAPRAAKIDLLLLVLTFSLGIQSKRKYSGEQQVSTLSIHQAAPQVTKMIEPLYRMRYTTSR